MQKYYVYTRVESNAPASELFYTMEVYRKDSGFKQYIVYPTQMLPVQANYGTQRHETIEISNRPQHRKADYIMEVMLYRKVGTEFIQVLDKPASSIVLLSQFTTAANATDISRHNICYFETSQQTKKSNDGEINTYQLKISCQERVFIAPERPIGHPDDPFVKADIEQALRERLRPYPGKYGRRLSLEEKMSGNISFPDQGSSNLCAPAAFFYCLLSDRPDLYQQVVRELWEVGRTQVGKLVISPSRTCKRPINYFTFDEKTRQEVPKVPPIDWMTLAGLRDSENLVVSYDTPDDTLAGVTLEGKVRSWFEEVGALCLKSYPIDCLTGKTVDQTGCCQLNDNFLPTTHVVTMIMAHILPPSNHMCTMQWIVWEDKLRIDDGNNQEVTADTPLDTMVKLRFFARGKIMSTRAGLTLGDFLKSLLGGVVVTHIP